MKRRKVAFTDDELLKVCIAIEEDGNNVNTARALHQAMPHHTLGSFRSLLNRIKAGAYPRAKGMVTSKQVVRNDYQNQITKYLFDEVVPTLLRLVDEMVTKQTQASTDVKEKLRAFVNAL